VSGKPTSTVREEADGKDPNPRHLASGPLHSGGDSGRRTVGNADTAPGVYLTKQQGRSALFQVEVVIVQPIVFPQVTITDPDFVMRLHTGPTIPNLTNCFA
jgi:hypothetical protein